MVAMPQPTTDTLLFTLAILSAPEKAASRRALCFARAVLESGHRIQRLFFYQNGVYNASSTAVFPQDEPDLCQQWRSFIIDNQLDAVVCVAAALRRGMLDAAEAERYGRNAATLQPPWQLSGLGQLHEGIQTSHRLVCFGDTP